MKKLYKITIVLFVIIGLNKANAQKSGTKPCLLAKYNFSGNTIDSSGNNVHLTNVGATLTKNRSGKVNSAYHFNGSQYLWASVNSQFSRDEFSTAFWIKPESSNDARILAVGPENTFWHYYCNTTVTGKYSFIGHNTNGSYSFYNYSTSSFKTNTWSHVVSVYKGDSIKIYVDGKLSIAGKTNNSVVKFSTNQILQIGAAYHPSSPLAGFVGDIDDIRIYCNALSQDQITKIYNEKDEDIAHNKSVSTLNSEINIYPNPSNNSFNIKYTINNGNRYNCYIYDNNGKIINNIVKIEGIGIEEISTEHIKSGVYYLKFINENSNEIEIKKLIIIH